MLLPYILTQLDAELDRLYHLREVVAGLQGTGVPALEVIAPVDHLPSPAPADEGESSPPFPAPVAKRLRRSSGPRGPRGPRARPAPEKETSAFAPAPSGIVVVSARDLQRERSLRGERRTAAPDGEGASAPVPEVPPEELARSLAARWLSPQDGQARDA